MAKRRPKPPKVGEWLLVDWEDASHYKGQAPAEDYPWKLLSAKSAGIVVKVDPKVLCVAQSEMVHDDGNRTLSDIDAIPRSCITRVRRFR